VNIDDQGVRGLESENFQHAYGRGSQCEREMDISRRNSQP
jgi:hypothetical protein